MSIIKNNLEKVYIYGTGTFAIDVEKALTKNSVNVVGFIDHVNREVENKNVFLTDEKLKINLFILKLGDIYIC